MNTALDDRKAKQAFENWINEHGFVLFQYILSLVGTKETAEDLYQEVLISAYINLHRLEKTSQFKGWIYKIALNKCRDYWRKKSTEQNFWKEKVYYYLGEKKAPLHPEDIVLNKNKQQQILDCIHELSPKYSEPLILYYYKNRTLAEISAVKELPLSTVKTRMRRARVQLQKLVSQSSLEEC